MVARRNQASSHGGHRSDRWGRGRERETQNPRQGCASQMGCLDSATIKSSPPPPRAQSPSLSSEAVWGWFAAWSIKAGSVLSVLSSEVSPAMDLFLYKTRGRGTILHQCPYGLDTVLRSKCPAHSRRNKKNQLPQRYLLPALLSGPSLWLEVTRHRTRFLGRETMNGGDASMSYGEDRAA